MCAGGRWQQGQGSVGRGWSAWLVTAPLAQSVSGARRHAERPACGSQAPPQSLCAGRFSGRQGARGQEPSPRVRSAHVLLGRPKSFLGFFPPKMLQKRPEGPFWPALDFTALALSISGWANLPVKSPRVNIFSSLRPTGSATTTLAAQRSHRPHAHEWPWHSTNKTLSQTVASFGSEAQFAGAQFT